MPIASACPPFHDLLSLARTEDSRPSSHEDHLAWCQQCTDTVEVIRQTMIELQIAGGERGADIGACLDTFDRARLVDGVVDEANRHAMLLHIVGCPECRHAVVAVSRSMSTSEVGAAVAELEDSSNGNGRFATRRVKGVGLAVAAAAVAVLFVGSWKSQEASLEDPVHRATILTDVAPPQLSSPSGPVGSPIVFRWSSVPTADQYRLTLFDAAGNIRWQTTTGDTTAPMPDSVRLSSGDPYFWQVAAQVGFDRWAEAEVLEFSPDGSPR